MPWGLTPAHLIIILVIVLIVVGPGKLPDTGAAIGKALRGFKDAMDGNDTNQAAAPQQPVAPAPPAQYPPAQYPPDQYPAPQAAPAHCRLYDLRRARPSCGAGTLSGRASGVGSR